MTVKEGVFVFFTLMSFLAQNHKFIMYNSKTVTPHKANLHYLKPLLGREEL